MPLVQLTLVENAPAKQMNETIKVAYDISLLGAGYISNQSRTGIFRVVEENVLVLIQRNSILVKPVSLNEEATIWDDISSFLYCKNEKPLLLSDFQMTHSSQFNLVGIYTALINFQKALISSSTSRKSLRYKTGRALNVLGTRLAKKETNTLTYRNDYDVYHGSYFPLPDSDILPDTSRVLTIYDLIPILFPQFVIPKVYQRAINMIKSIDIKKDWIICISEHTKRDFCQYTGMDSARVFVTPLAAASYFYPVEKSSSINEVLDRYNIPRKALYIEFMHFRTSKKYRASHPCFL